MDLTGVGAIFDFGGKLIDKIFPDKLSQEKERAAATLALASMEQSGEIERLRISMSAILAEAASQDPWTSRARPTFLYVMYILFLAAIPMGILSAFFPAFAKAVITGMQDWLNGLPNELYILFGTGYLGYTASRSYDKKQQLKAETTKQIVTR